MDFLFFLTPIAEASNSGFYYTLNKIFEVIVNPIISFLFVLATAYFIFSIVRYLFNSEDKEGLKKMKESIVNGLIGMIVMVSVFGIIKFYLATIGSSEVKIDNNGKIQVEDIKIKSIK